MKAVIFSKYAASIISLVLLVFPAPSSAVTFPDKPSKESYYTDLAGLITPEDGNKINQIAGKLWVEENIPIIVATIKSLADYEAAGYSIEGYTADLFDDWGIGSNERNYGILLLVSKGDRKARIEFGAGFGREYDRQANEIMQSLIVPKFKTGNFSTGILEGVRGLDAVARGLALPKPEQPWWLLPLFIASVIGIIALVYNLFKTGKTGWAWAVIIAVGAMLMFMLWSASRSGGSGSSFGGGFSGGGGATGSW